jgi:hypothetical protein
MLFGVVAAELQDQCVLAPEVTEELEVLRRQLRDIDNTCSLYHADKNAHSTVRRPPVGVFSDRVDITAQIAECERDLDQLRALRESKVNMSFSVCYSLAAVWKLCYCKRQTVMGLGFYMGCQVYPVAVAASMLIGCACGRDVDAWMLVLPPPFIHFGDLLKPTR